MRETLWTNRSAMTSVPNSKADEIHRWIELPISRSLALMVHWMSRCRSRYDCCCERGSPLGDRRRGAVAVAAVRVGAYQGTVALQELILGIDPHTGSSLTTEYRVDVAAGLAGAAVGGGLAGGGAEVRIGTTVPGRTLPEQHRQQDRRATPSSSWRA